MTLARRLAALLAALLAATAANALSEEWPPSQEFGDRIYHTHMKDVHWSSRPTRAGVFGGHLNFGHTDRYWDFRSLGRGCVNFEAIIRALNDIRYDGPLSVEWEDGGMDREHGAAEACGFVRRLDFPGSARAFDAAFSED